MSEFSATHKISYEEFQAGCKSHDIVDKYHKDATTRDWRIPTELVQSLRDGSLVVCNLCPKGVCDICVPVPKNRWAEMSDSEQESDFGSPKSVVELPPRIATATKGPRNSRKIANKSLASTKPTEFAQSPAEPATQQVSTSAVCSEDIPERDGSGTAASCLPQSSGSAIDVAHWVPRAAVPNKDLRGENSSELHSRRTSQVRRGTPDAGFGQPPPPSLSGSASAKAAKGGALGRGRDSKFQCQFKVGIEEEAEFRVVRRIIGPAGASVKAIAAETSAKLRLRGKGSKFLEGPEQRESTDDLMLCVSAPSSAQLAASSRLVAEILERVYSEYDTHRALKKLSPLGLRIQMHQGPRKGAR